MDLQRGSLRLSPFRTALVLATALALTQLLIAWFLSPAPGLGPSYLGLCSWDCGWYKSIAELGYRSTIPPVAQNGNLSNVAFFPGYPMIARALHLATGVDVRWWLLVTAQFFCAAFWLGLLLWLERYKVPGYARVLAVAAIFAHPAAFYLVLGYSESLFLSSLLFFLYWSDSPRSRDSWLAAGAGFLMTATRIVGLPVAAYPLVRLLAQKGWKAPHKVLTSREALRAWLVFGGASLGCLSFLAYCQLRFGDWRLYMETQHIGWGIVPDYGALWNWARFHYIVPYEQVATLASGVGFAVMWLAELGWAARNRKQPSAVRIPLYVCASLIFYVTLSGLESLWFRSMIRYTLPWWLLAVLCLAEISSRLSRPHRKPAVASRVVLLAGVGSLAVFYWFCELPHLVDFLNGRWFA